MIKVGNKILKNGMRLIYVQDRQKHGTTAKMIINFGNREQSFIYRGKEYNIEDGSAHLLEHLVIESNNMNEYYLKNNVSYNAFTSSMETSYYIKTMIDFERHFEKFLIMINTLIIDKRSLDRVVRPIINEIQKSKDQMYYDFYTALDNNFFLSMRMGNLLGNSKKIGDISVKMLKMLHHVFYQPKNQTLCLIGNFDLDKVEEMIDKIYQKLNIKNVKYILKRLEEPMMFKQNLVRVINNKSNEIASLNFKIDISHLLPKERVKLTFYLNYFFDSNFSDDSDTFQEVLKNNYANYSFNKGYDVYEKTLLRLTIELYTKNVQEFKDLVLNTINNFKLDKDDFDLWKKGELINLLNRNIYISSRADAYVNNILDYSYDEEDKVSDIENFSLDDYCKIMRSLNYDQYLLVYQTKK